MNKLEAMKRFVLVAQTSSFTKSAEMLGLPKASVSSSIQSLESHIGLRLLHRSTRKVTLTQDGESYLIGAQQILNDIDVLESEFQIQQHQVSGPIRVDMPSRFANAILIPNLSAWHRKFPNTHLKISCSDQTINLFNEGVDCAIRVGELKDSALIARPITQYPIINCISPAYQEMQGLPLTLDDLSQHHLIHFTHTFNQAQSSFEYQKHNKTKYIPMKPAIAVNNTEAYLNACLSGLGIAQIPLISAVDYLKSHQLLSILPAFQPEPMPVSIIYASRRQLPRRLTLFMDWLCQIVRKHSQRP